MSLVSNDMPLVWSNPGIGLHSAISGFAHGKFSPNWNSSFKDHLFIIYLFSIMGRIHSPFCCSQRFLKTPKSTTIFGMENSLKETPKAAFGDSRLHIPLWERVHTTWHISLDHEPHSWQYVQHSSEPFLGRCRRRWSFCSGPSPGLCCLLLELLRSQCSQRREPRNSWNKSSDFHSGVHLTKVLSHEKKESPVIEPIAFADPDSAIVAVKDTASWDTFF